MEKCIRFPGFRYRALTLSYDDGVIYDGRLLDIMSAHGIKGTFNLNAGLMPAETGGNRRFNAADAARVYANPCAEVAAHGFYHIHPCNVDSVSFLSEMFRDRMALEAMTGKIVRGMAYAYGGCSEVVENAAAAAGIVYSRTVRSTHAFNLPAKWLEWHPTCHHNDGELDALCDRFLADKGTLGWQVMMGGPQVFYLWGHSYEFNDNNNWEIIEKFCEKMGGHEDIWYATNGEIYDYIEAARSLIWSLDQHMAFNPTCVDVYMNVDGKPTLFPAGQTTRV